MKTHINIKSITILILLSIMLLPSCSMERKFSKTYYTVFDSDTTITGYDTLYSSFENRADELMNIMKEYNNLYDIYYEYDNINNIKTINDNAGISPVKVDKRIINLIKFGKEIYDLTNGMTNIALGSVLSIWHNYREEGISVPDEKELINASQHTDINSIIIDESEETVYISDPDTRIDVGAIAKGYTTERIAEYAKEKGWTDIALSVGGNIRVIGSQPDGSNWDVGIRNPDVESDNAVLTRVYISNKSVVTSGSYIRYYEIDGVKYHHIINPNTLYPENNFLSVTIICEDSGIADALSTALFNLSENDGRKIIGSLENVEAMWVYPDLSVSKTDGFND